jgi:hypothetical protein
MDRSFYMSVGPLWGIMIIWLGMVICSGIIAFKVWRRAVGQLKRQMFYLWIGPIWVVIGDFIHSIAFTVAKYTGDPTGPIPVMGSVFEFRTFAMFFDGLAFILYYGLWALFVAARYRHGVFILSDRVRILMAITAAILLLPGMVPNALGIYSLEYDIAIWSPHMLLFIIFGPWAVWELLQLSRATAAEASDLVVQAQEQALSRFCCCLLFSFLFFALTLSLRPLNEKFSLFMIPKTFAYMSAFYYLIKGFLAPELRRLSR